MVGWSDAGGTGGRIGAVPGRGLAAWPLIARIDARRPASWAAALVAAAAAGLGTSSLALIGGALAAVVGLGDPPRGLVAVGPGPSASWSAVRSLWPLAGCCLPAALGCDAMACAIVALAVVATTFVEFVAAVRGLTATDAAALGLVAAAAAYLCGCVSVDFGRGFLPAASGAWLAAAGGCLWLVAPPDPIAAWRRGVQAAAMTTTLAAMAGCFFLAPERSGWYAPLAAAWFLAVALPHLTLGAGTLDESARERLLRAAGPSGAARGFPRACIDVARRAGGLAASWAAILGWPAMVAAVLWGNDAARADGPVVAVLIIAAVAAAVVVVSGGVEMAGGGAETRLAVVTIVVMGAVTWLSSPLPARPAPPRREARSPRQTGVEGFQASCETSQPTQIGSSRLTALRGHGTGRVRVEKGGLFAR